MCPHLRIVSQFSAEEHEWVHERLAGPLERQLARSGGHELELSVKERDTASQKVVLACWVDGKPKLVTTSTKRSLDAALLEVRDDMARSLRRRIERQTDQSRRRSRR